MVYISFERKEFKHLLVQKRDLHEEEIRVISSLFISIIECLTAMSSYVVFMFVYYLSWSYIQEKLSFF